MTQLDLSDLLARYGVAPPPAPPRPRLRTTVWRKDGSGIEVEEGPGGELISSERMDDVERAVAVETFAFKRQWMGD